eukprot:scaffold21500_cov58-Attheya_sp.AAC.6
MLEHAMELLRKQVSIVVNTGHPGIDQAIIVLTSPGGSSVSAYGLASSQLIRICKACIQLVICVDTVAVSGGYMMASVFDMICAAPFASTSHNTPLCRQGRILVGSTHQRKGIGRSNIYLLLGGVTILKQLTGLEYALCPSSLFNTAYVQGARRGAPRMYYMLRLTP